MPKPKGRLLALLLCFLLLFPAKPARADSFHTIAVEVVVSIVLVSAAITVGIVLAIKHRPSLKGCAVGGPSGLELKDGDGQLYSLIGDTTGIHPGDRVRVSGQKQKHTEAKRFIVEKTRVYGPCPA